MNMLKNKEGKLSKTKLGAVLIGLGAILGTVGAWMTGSLDPMSAIQSLIVEFGVVSTILGLRDLPILNPLFAKK